MPASVFVEVVPNQMNIAAGGAADARVRVTNHSNAVGQYQVKVREPESRWVRLEPEQVGVFPGEWAEVSMRVQPPGDRVFITYQINVVVTNQLDASDQAAAVLALSVQKPGGVFPAAQPGGSQPLADPGRTTPSIPAKNDITRRNSPAALDQTRPYASPETRMPEAAATGSRLGEPPEAQTTSPAGDLLFTADRNPLTVLPGAPQSFLFQLSNMSGASMQLALACKGLPASWLALDSERVFLAPGQSCQVTLKVSMDEQAPLGDYPLVVSAEGDENSGLLLRLNLVVKLVKAGEILLKLNPSLAEGETSANFEVQLNQSGLTPVTVQLAASDAGGELHYAFSPARVTLPASGQVSSRLQVSAPPARRGGFPAVYSFNVTASPINGSAMPVSAQGQFTSKPAPQAVLALLPPEQRAPVKATFLLRVSNPSQSGDTYILSAQDQDGSCGFEFQSPALTVPAGGQAKTVVSAAARSFLEVGEQVHTFTITARSRSRPEGSVQIQGRFIQTAAQLPRLEIIPPSRASYGPASYTLQVSNPGANPLEIDLRPDGENRMYRFMITPERLLVPPGRQAAARLDIAPLQPLLPGEDRREGAFRVMGYATVLSSPITAQGTQILVRRKKTQNNILLYLLTGLVFLCSIITIMAILYFGYLR